MASIYQKNFINRSQNLKHVGENDSKPIIAVNPLCGDRQEIYIKTNNGRYSEILFIPQGCMVSQVATDVLIDAITGKDINYIEKITLNDLSKLMEIEVSKTREKCVELSLKKMKGELKGH